MSEKRVILRLLQSDWACYASDVIFVSQMFLNRRVTSNMHSPADRYS